MKTNRNLLIALAVVLLLCIGLAIYAISLSHKVDTLSDDSEDYMILDTADSNEDGDSEKPNKKKEATVEELVEAGQKNSSSSANLQKDPILEDSIQRILDSSGGTWDVWTESLANHTYTHNETSSSSAGLVSASLIKLFVMGTVYQEVENGTIAKEDVYQDIRNMIAVSDNDAANRLIRLLGNGDGSIGMAKINQFARNIGCSNTSINRLMLEENGNENYTSAEDCAKILRLIYYGECVNKNYSSEMMECLAAQEVNDRIPQSVPAGVTVAHKTGNLTNLSNGDVGIVLIDSNPYIICVINNSSQGDGVINDSIIDISEAAYNYYKVQ